MNKVKNKSNFITRRFDFEGSLYHSLCVRTFTDKNETRLKIVSILERDENAILNLNFDWHHSIKHLFNPNFVVEKISAGKWVFDYLYKSGSLNNFISSSKR